MICGNTLAASIEDDLCQGNLRTAEKTLTKELSDLLDHVTWFSKKGGFAARQVRNRAEIDRLWIRVALDDLLDAQDE